MATDLIKVPFGKDPINFGDYDALVAQGKTSFGILNRVNRYGCEFESLYDNNTEPPAVWDGGDQITISDQWRLTLGNPDTWLLSLDKPAADQEHPNIGMGRVTLKPKYDQENPYYVQQSDFEDGEGNPLVNTIFVIRYDFTLSEDITIPSGCVLKFEGGSISGNGTGKNTITSDYVVIESDKKCFIGILFAGNCVNQFFHTKWFTDASLTKDASVDNTTELQQLFNIGVKNIVFNPGYYHISNTLTINSDCNLYAEFETNTQVERNSGEASKAIVWSADVVTLLDYTYNTNRGKGTLHIGNIHFRCEIVPQAITEVSANTPIVNIQTGNSVLWGCNVYACVSASVGNNGSGTLYYDHTGIRFYASEGGYIAFVRVYGEITDTYNAYIAEKHSNQWFNGFEIYGHTCCVKGIDTTIGPLIIHNEHQALDALTIFGSDAYFHSRRVQYYGYVYDVGGASMPNGISIAKAVESEMYYNGNERLFSGRTKSTRENGAINNNIPANNVYVSGTYIPLFTPIDFTRKNLLTLLESADSDCGSTVFPEFSYKVNNTSIFEIPGATLYNKDKLFTNNFHALANDNGFYMQHEETAWLMFAARTTCKIEVSFTIYSRYFDSPTMLDQILFIHYAFGYLPCSVVIKGSNDLSEWNTIKEYSFNTSRILDQTGLIYLSDLYNTYSYLNFKITIENAVASNELYLPKLYFTTQKELREVHALGTDFRLPTIKTGERIGFNYYDTVYGKQIYWTGNPSLGTNGWVDATGNQV